MKFKYTSNCLSTEIRVLTLPPGKKHFEYFYFHILDLMHPCEFVGRNIPESVHIHPHTLTSLGAHITIFRFGDHRWPFHRSPFQCLPVLCAHVKLVFT